MPAAPSPGPRDRGNSPRAIGAAALGRRETPALLRLERALGLAVGVVPAVPPVASAAYQDDSARDDQEHDQPGPGDPQLERRRPAHQSPRTSRMMSPSGRGGWSSRAAAAASARTRPGPAGADRAVAGDPHRHAARARLLVHRVEDLRDPERPLGPAARAGDGDARA